jgi:tRNA pseudouridine55 synthase
MHNFGFLWIHKPVGMSSFGVVRRLKKITGEKRIGHSGTLDPLASGVMILAIGRPYTKKLNEYLKLDKTYQAELTLGFNTATWDAEGEKIFISDKQPSDEEITEVLASFVGEQMQVPPIFSALKMNGQPLYKLARKGTDLQEENLGARRITIYDLRLLSYSYPVLKFDVDVSTGTYIRSLARDIGKKLGTGAYLSGLVRSKLGTVNLADCVALDDLTEGNYLDYLKE